MDDRSTMCDSVDQLISWTQEWSNFEQLGRLKTQNSKSQFWGRTSRIRADLLNAGFPPKNCLQVFGVSLQASGGTLEDSERQQVACQRATKIAQLPVSFRLKGRLAATVFATKAAWGLYMNGRKATSALARSFFGAYNRATKSGSFPGGRASIHLRCAFFLVHTCDLNLFQALRSIRSSFKWFLYRQKCGIQASWTASILF